MYKRSVKNWAAAAAVALLLASGVRAEDSLFSGGSLFGQATKPSESTSKPDSEADYSPGEDYEATPNRPVELTDENIEATLRQAGLTPRQDEGQRVVDLEVAGLTTPATVELANNRLVIAIKLRGFTNASDIPAIQAQQMLQANAVIAPATFGFNLDRKQLELKLALRNVGLNAEQLKLEFEGLAKLAGQTSQLWSFDPNSQANQPTNPPPQSGQPAAPSQNGNAGNTPNANPGINLVGRWIVELSQGGGFVIRFENDGKFQLGHVKSDGKIDRSQGTFSIEKGQLILKSDDGSTLQGKFAAVNADQFNFAVGNGQGLVFKRR